MPIRNLREEDLGFAIDLVLKEGWMYNRVELERMLRIDPEGSFLYEEQEPLGFVTCLTYKKTAVVGHLVVSETARGKKIGKALLRKVIEYSSAKGVDSIILYATEEGVQVYRGEGFRVLAEVLCIRASKDKTVPTPQYPGLSLVGKGDLEEISRVDAKMFGDERSSLLTSLRDDYPELCFKLEREGRIQGYAFGRTTSTANDFGPWVCLTGLEADAKALFESVIGRFDDRDVFIGVFKENQTAVSIANLMRPVRVWDTKLMVRGEPRYSAESDKFLGLAGFELG